MNGKSLAPSRDAIRPFFVCPHCIRKGRDGLLFRYTNFFPMIARSDGDLFHLLLADRPRPYPAEKGLESNGQVSLGFHYSHKSSGNQVCVSIVILPNNKPYSMYRTIECIADCLAEQLSQQGSLCPMYEIVGWKQVARSELVLGTTG